MYLCIGSISYKAAQCMHYVCTDICCSIWRGQLLLDFRLWEIIPEIANFLGAPFSANVLQYVHLFFASNMDLTL